MALSFSLLPLEIQEEIASSLSYKEIINLCDVETALVNICADQDFWRGLILKRYPEYQGDPRFTTDPQDLFRHVEENTYQIILNSPPAKTVKGRRKVIVEPQKELLIFRTDDEEIIATTIAVVSVVNRSAMKIIKPNGELLTYEEAMDISQKYYPPVLDIKRKRLNIPEGKSLITFETKRKFGRESYLYIPDDTDQDIVDYIFELLDFLEASNVKIEQDDE